MQASGGNLDVVGDVGRKCQKGDEQNIIELDKYITMNSKFNGIEKVRLRLPRRWGRHGRTIRTA